MVTFLGITAFGGLLLLCVLFFLLIILNAKRSQICVDDDKAIEIFKIIEALREVCPIGSSRGWTLVANHCSMRCWRKTFSLKVFGSSLPIYSSCTRLNVSPVFVLNVIADVTTWPEWDSAIHHQPLQAEISDDPELHGDSYMQCDQLVAMTVGKNPKPGILMHRFGNLEENGVGWILLWHLSQLDWCCFLAQPLETQGGVESGCCLLTMIAGKNPYMVPKEDMALQLATKLRNLKDAISRSRLQIRPFLLASSASNLNNPHLPTIQSALNDLSSSPCVLLQQSPKARKTDKAENRKDTVLCAVPFASSTSINLKNLKGFVLVSKPSGKLKDTEQSDKGRVRKRHKTHTRSVQETESKDKIKTFESFSLSEPTVSTMPTVTVTKPEEDKPILKKKSVISTLINQTRRLSDTMLSDMELQQSMKPTNENLTVEKFRPRSRSTSDHFEKKSCQDKASSDRESGFFGNLLAKARKLSVSSGNLSSAASLLKEEKAFQKTEKPEKVQSKMEVTGTANSLEEKEKREANKDTDDLLSATTSGESQNYEQIGAKCISTLLSEVDYALKTAISVSNNESKCVPGKWICYNGGKDLTTLMKLQNTEVPQTISYLSHGKISSSKSTIWDTLSNPLSRFVYDESVKKITVLQKLPNEQKIVYRYHEIVSLLKKEVQDFCLLQTLQKEKARLILGYESIESSSCPPQDDIYRGMILPSGWIVEPTGKGKKSCIVTHLEQLQIPFPESQLVEEMGLVHSQCITSLKRYLTSKPF